MRLQLEWNGTPIQLIELCDELAKDGTEYGLDSLDLGDAMGFIITETMIDGGEYKVIRGELELRAWIDYDLFNWEGIDAGTPTIIR